MGYWERRDAERDSEGRDWNTLALAVVAIVGLTYALYRLRAPDPAPRPPLVNLNAVRVVDGDTLDFGWDTTMRLRGIDTPEHIHRAGCDEEREMAALADAYARDLIDSADGIHVDLSERRGGYGRYVGTVTLVVNGRDVDYGEAMIAAGHARVWDYEGGQPRPEWCG